MKYSKAVKRLIKLVWEGREEGTHAWMKNGSHWITVEPFEEEGKDFLAVSVTNRIDDLGYPMGTMLACDYLYEEEIKCILG